MMGIRDRRLNSHALLDIKDFERSFVELIVNTPSNNLDTVLPFKLLRKVHQRVWSSSWPGDADGKSVSSGVVDDKNEELSTIVAWDRVRPPYVSMEELAELFLLAPCRVPWDMDDCTTSGIDRAEFTKLGLDLLKSDFHACAALGEVSYLGEAAVVESPMLFPDCFIKEMGHRSNRSVFRWVKKLKVIESVDAVGVADPESI